MLKNVVTKYCHLGNKHISTGGRITIASCVTGRTVKYGIAYCSKKDNFKKSLGRLIAYNRLEQYDSVISLDLDEMNHKGIMLAILHDVIEYKEYPFWAFEILMEYIDWYDSNKSTESHFQKDYDDDTNLVLEWLADMPKIENSELCSKIVSEYFNTK